MLHGAGILTNIYRHLPEQNHPAASCVGKYTSTMEHNMGVVSWQHQHADGVP